MWSKRSIILSVGLRLRAAQWIYFSDCMLATLPGSVPYDWLKAFNPGVESLLAFEA